MLNTLQEEIDYWEKTSYDDFNEDYRNILHNRPLCLEYLKYTNSECEGCPLYETTGEKLCYFKEFVNVTEADEEDFEEYKEKLIVFIEKTYLDLMMEGE